MENNDDDDVVEQDSMVKRKGKDVINVQFFPCKVCGAKFPSYYFVHKHRKMWHENSDSDAN